MGFSFISALAYAHSALISVFSCSSDALHVRMTLGG